MYLCCNRSKPETIKYTVGIDQSYRDNRRFGFQCNFKTAGFKVTDMIAVIKIIPTLREQDITFSILNIFRYFIDNGQRLTYIFLSSRFPSNRSINSFTRMVLDFALSITMEQGLRCV